MKRKRTQRELDCARAKQHGLTLAQLYDLLGRTHCDACGEAFEPGTHGLLTRHIDHDHATGQVRGVLHHRCNTALGLLRDDPLLMTRVLAYLLRAREGVVWQERGQRQRPAGGVYVYARTRGGVVRWVVEHRPGAGRQKRYRIFKTELGARSFADRLRGFQLVPTQVPAHAEQVQ